MPAIINKASYLGWCSCSPFLWRTIRVQFYKCWLGLKNLLGKPEIGLSWGLSMLPWSSHCFSLLNELFHQVFGHSMLCVQRIMFVYLAFNSVCMANQPHSSCTVFISKEESSCTYWIPRLECLWVSWITRDLYEHQFLYFLQRNSI